jgi:hypothetical protein
LASGSCKSCLPSYSPIHRYLLCNSFTYFNVFNKWICA